MVLCVGVAQRIPIKHVCLWVERDKKLEEYKPCTLLWFLRVLWCFLRFGSGLLGGCWYLVVGEHSEDVKL